MDNSEKLKILIVDDERSNIITLNHILKPTYSTFAAIDGHIALDIARRSIPDLVLLDIVMPGMTGFEVLTELKRDNITKNIPVIFITGLDSAEDEETGFFLGAVDYITKPFHNSIVKARVKTHLQMSGYIHEIEHFGMTDTLTGIANRRGFDSRIALEWVRSIREHEPISILIIDIDNFKKYNDKYGHMQGDILLKAVAEVFLNTFNRGSDFAARWGGEEFVVLLPNTDTKGAMAIAEHIRVNIESLRIPYHDKTLTSTTVSIGVTTEIPIVGSVTSDFISKADKAMYNAKNAGRNRICSI